MNRDWMTNEEACLLNEVTSITTLPNGTFSQARRQFSANIKNIKHIIRTMQKEKILWPVQWSKVISSLSNTKISVLQIGEMIDQQLCSATILHESTGWKLVIQLSYIQERLDELQGLIKAIHSSCRTPSKQVEKKRAEIFRKLEFLMLHCDDIIESMAVIQQNAQIETTAHDTLLLKNIEQPHDQFHHLPMRTGRNYYGKRHLYIVPRREGVVEKCDVSKQKLIEEEQPTLREIEQQECKCVPNYSQLISGLEKHQGVISSTDVSSKAERVTKQ